MEDWDHKGFPELPKHPLEDFFLGVAIIAGIYVLVMLYIIFK